MASIRSKSVKSAHVRSPFDWELAKAGITEVAAANTWIREVYLPAHNARFAKPAAVPESAFVKADAAVLAETLCVQEERVVGRDNTVSFDGLALQLPESPLRHHFVKARVRVHHYPNNALAVFHGPRCIARYSPEGRLITIDPTSPRVPTPSSVTPCSPPSRRGLEAAEIVEGAERRPSLTAAARGVTSPGQVGTKKRSRSRTKKLPTGSSETTASP